MTKVKQTHPAMIRLYEALISKGLIAVEARQSSFAKLLNTTSQRVNNWERRGPSKEICLECQRDYGINASWVETGLGDMDAHSHEVSDRLVLSSAADGGAAPEPTEPGAEFTAVRRVRLKVSAGVTGFHVEPLNGDGLPIFFRADWLKSRHLRADRLLAVRVNGDSMSPGLYDGDLVVINTESTEPKDGEVFVINYEGEAVIKRLKRDGGQWWLSSDNPDKVRYGDKRCDEHAIVIGQVIYKQSEHI